MHNFIRNFLQQTETSILFLYLKTFTSSSLLFLCGPSYQIRTMSFIHYCSQASSVTFLHFHGTSFHVPSGLQSTYSAHDLAYGKLEAEVLQIMLFKCCFWPQNGAKFLSQASRQNLHPSLARWNVCHTSSQEPWGRQDPEGRGAKSWTTWDGEDTGQRILNPRWPWTPALLITSWCPWGKSLFSPASLSWPVNSFHQLLWISLKGVSFCILGILLRLLVYFPETMVLWVVRHNYPVHFQYDKTTALARG